MRPESSPDDAFLWDMLDAARSILQFTEGLELADYSADLLVRRATERSLQILGEAARRISEELKGAHPEIPWRAIVGQRNVIVHDYVDLSSERLWEVIENDLPSLVAHLEQLLPAVPEE